MPVIEEARPEEIEIHLLIDTDEQTVRSRRREAAAASIVVHLAVLALLIVGPHIFGSAVDSASPESRRLSERSIYLEMPPDDQVVKEKPKTAIASDKDRLAQPGRPNIPSRSLPPLPAARPPVQQENEADRRALAQALPPPPQIQPPGAPAGVGKLQVPAPGAPAPPMTLQDIGKDAPKLTAPASGSQGHSLEDAMRGVARERASGGGGPAVNDPGTSALAQRMGGVVGQAQILTDTQGVNFDPYLQRIVAAIRRNWYAVMPEVARMGKRGRVVVVFEVQRDGMVPKLFLVSTSGSEPLDRAALAGISSSVPFMPLPSEFKGPLIRLQVTFLYNMALQQ